MGLWIGPPFQGKGYATSAVKRILKYGFETLGMQKIEAKIFVGNIASRRVFEKCGFQLEGTIRRAEIKRGKFVDEWLFGILKEEAQ
jgi:RimJ/RimL family protein N-acetyltransferase